MWFLSSCSIVGSLIEGRKNRLQEPSPEDLPRTPLVVRFEDLPLTGEVSFAFKAVGDELDSLTKKIPCVFWG